MEEGSLLRGRELSVWGGSLLWGEGVCSGGREFVVGKGFVVRGGSLLWREGVC